MFIDQVDRLKKAGYDINPEKIQFGLLQTVSGVAGKTSKYLAKLEYSPKKKSNKLNDSYLKMWVFTRAGKVTSITYLDDNDTDRFKVGTKKKVYSKNTLPVLPKGLVWRLHRTVVGIIGAKPIPGGMVAQVMNYTFKIVIDISIK